MSLNLTPSVITTVRPNIRPKVIYEDESLLVLHKPAGLPSAPNRSSANQTAVDFALARAPEIKGVGRELKRELEPALLHRLDTGTSGLLVFAKTQLEFDRLVTAWKTKEVQKFYRALIQTQNPIPLNPLCLNSPLAHDARSAKKMIALDSLHPKHIKSRIRGKPLPAITRILSIKVYPNAMAPFCQNTLENQADLEIQIETGVMHQIRCHLSSAGWPILGDVIYRGTPSERLWLHAWRLQLPLQGKKVLKLEAQLPDKWPESK